jgi:hypothetical protein
MEMSGQLHVPTTLSAENDGYEDMGNSVCISTGYGLGGREIGVRFPGEARNLSLLHGVDTSTGAHWGPHRPLFNGYQGLLLWG